MLPRFILIAALALLAPGAHAAPPSVLDGVIVQTIDLQIPDAAHYGVSAIVGMNMPLGTGDLVGRGNAGDVAAVARALSADDPSVAEPGGYPGAGFRVVVQLDNGVLVVLLQPRKPRPSVGRLVRIEGGGRSARAVPREVAPAP